MLATAIVTGSPRIAVRVGYGNVSEFGLPNIVPNLKNYSRWFRGADHPGIRRHRGAVRPGEPVVARCPRSTVVVAPAVSLLPLLAEFCYFSSSTTSRLRDSFCRFIR
jgi:hypothetical protein